MTSIANLSLDAGASFSSDVDVKTEDGSPFDLTGYTIQANLSKGYSYTKNRIAFTSTHDDLNGIITISLTPEQTIQLEEGRYVYDVQVTNTGTGLVTRIIEGIITVNPSVSEVYLP
jgi:hypothetical protein